MNVVCLHCGTMCDDNPVHYQGICVRCGRDMCDNCNSGGPVCNDCIDEDEDYDLESLYRLFM